MFASSIESQFAFDAFCSTWLELYERGQPFCMLLDLRALVAVSMKYCYCMFLRLLKGKRPQLLNFSVVVVHGSLLARLLRFIFQIESLVAPV